MSAKAPVHLEFAPPPTRGLFGALVLAFIVHLLLLTVLALGVRWKRDAPPAVVEAELWSALPVQAAPPTPIAPPPEQQEQPTPPVEKPVVVPPAPEVAPTPPLVDPAIAIAKEKARLEKEKEKKEQLLAQKEKEKRQHEAQKAEKLKQEQAAREKEQRDKIARDKKLQLEQQKALAANKDAEAKKLADFRQQQLARMAKMANQEAGNGDSSSTGSAKQSSGPSASYAGRIVARIKPNITYTESPTGNPVADVEVRTSPDGTIISRRLVKSSGIKSWDDAVINAIDKTEKLPPDVDGRVIPSLTLGFRPKD